MIRPLFTIGHSNYSPERFVELLQLHGITALADVRSIPYSRYLPHVNQAGLKSYLAQADIRYVFLGKELGARPDNPDCYVDGKARYENIAATEAFQRGLKRILTGLQQHRIALMCAEKDPLTCHRAILVCRNLVQFNLEIGHIHPDGSIEYHENLEDRMLAIHGLQEQGTGNQLSLFEPVTGPTLSRDERLVLAYQVQGDKIAYVEKDYVRP